MKDLIDRQAAIDMIEEYFNGLPIAVHYDMLAMIHRLPSAQPEREKGKWIEKEVVHADEAKEAIEEWQSCRCSECGRYDTRPYIYCFSEPRFCSYCGADMRGDTE